jgi:hypothetical protein
MVESDVRVACSSPGETPGREGRIGISNMNAISGRMVSSLALAVFLALLVGGTALANHVRPGSGTPFRVPLEPEFQICGTADSTHVFPLNLPSCTTPDPRIESEILTMSTKGSGAGFLKLTTYCTDAVTPPCNPTNGTDTEDVRVQFFQSDVLCAVGGITGCTAAGADYTAPLIVRMKMRITDHSNGSPSGSACATPTGNPPCVTATVQDKDFSFQSSCVATSGASGAVCQTDTTLDTILPGTVKEQQRAVVGLLSVSALDMGPDGFVGGACPPTCGTGDETRYLAEATFTP